MFIMEEILFNDNELKKFVDIKFGQFAFTKDEVVHDKKDKLKRRIRAMKKAERRYKHKKKT